MASHTLVWGLRLSCAGRKWCTRPLEPSNYTYMHAWPFISSLFNLDRQGQGTASLNRWRFACIASWYVRFQSQTLPSRDSGHPSASATQDTGAQLPVLCAFLSLHAKCRPNVQQLECSSTAQVITHSAFPVGLNRPQAYTDYLTTLCIKWAKV